MLVHKKLSHLLPCFTSNGTTLGPHYLLRTILQSFTSTTQDPHPMVEYLITQLGFSTDQAIHVSKPLTHLKSTKKPETVVRFLEHTGFSDTHIRNFIHKYPRLLCAKVEKTLEPKVRAIQELGFSGPQLIRLVSQNPSALRVCDVKPKIEFFRTLFKTDEELLKAMRADYLLTCSLKGKIMPNISLLRECGIADRQIAKMIMHDPFFVTRRTDSIKVFIERALELGVPQAPGMLFYLFHAISNLSRATVDSKIALLRSFGWSEEEVMSAIKRTPYVLKVSEKKARAAMEFFVKEARCEPSYLALHPVLLLYNLTGRLVPRYRVMKTLKKKRLLNRNFALPTVMAITEKKFVEKFIIPYEKQIPKLYKNYVAAAAGRVST